MRYKFKRKPYAHQKDAIRKLVSTGFGGALLMEPRTGKTKTLIDYVCILHEAGLVNRVLVSCPVAVMGVWEDELAKNVPDRIKYTLTVWDKDARKDTPLPKWGKDQIDFVVINHDAFATAGEISKFSVFESKRFGEKLANGEVDMKRLYHFSRGRDRLFHCLNPGDREPWMVEAIAKKKKTMIVRSNRRGGRYDMKKAFILWQPQLVALDESHRFKSASAAKFRTFQSVIWAPDGTARVPYRVLMTGTAVTKKKRLFDIYAQWKLLNPERFRGMTFSDFKHTYARFINKGNYEMWIGNKPREVELLRARIHKDSFAITRDECFDLPHAVHQQIPIDLTGESASAYDEMAEDMVARLKSGEIIEASIKLVMTMRLLQISSGVGKTSPTETHPKGQLVRIGTDKRDVFESLAFDLWEADEKIVVAARFTHDIATVEEVCKKHKIPVFILQGRRKGPNQSRQERTAAIAKFKSMDGPACFVVQPQSGSMGIDLSTASTLIWYSLTSSWVDYTQMNDRIALNPHSVSLIHLIASPADQLAYDTLQEDGDIARAVTESPDRLLRNYKAKVA